MRFAIVFSSIPATIERMFSHLRYLAAISFVIMAIGAVFIVVYASNFKEQDMLEGASSQTKATLDSYVGAVWERYGDELSKNPTSPYLPGFAQETQRFFKTQPVAKITVFSPDVAHLYYGSGPEYITTDGTTRVPLFDISQALSGTMVKRVLKDVYITGGAAPNAKHTMVQVIVPLLREGHAAPDALAEIYVDVTVKWELLARELKIFLGAILGVFTLLMGVLLFTASRAESIITKQHEVNMELIAAAAQAEAQSRDKSQFLASVSHELRTPLNAIIGFSDIIRNEAKEMLQRIHQDYLEDIHASGKHLLSLINDILDFSKAEAGKLQIEWAETDANKVIRNSLRMVLPRAEAAQVTLVEDLPTTHLVIVTDAKKLKQVLLNLLSNAVKFTPAGGEVRCHAWMDLMKGSLVIEVRDTGIGIAPKDISRVMTPFGQVDSALSRKYEGTGLGLPLSKKFVESMGGDFAIESQIKVGTTVTVSIPKAPHGWGTASMAEYSTQEEMNDVASTSHTA
jgi:two-component system cell cycle sensor histidine kinase PleC